MEPVWFTPPFTLSSLPGSISRSPRRLIRSGRSLFLSGIDVSWLEVDFGSANAVARGGDVARQPAVGLVELAWRQLTQLLRLQLERAVGRLRLLLGRRHGRV